jgi:hypothetical protein
MNTEFASCKMFIPKMVPYWLITLLGSSLFAKIPMYIYVYLSCAPSWCSFRICLKAYSHIHVLKRWNLGLCRVAESGGHICHPSLVYTNHFMVDLGADLLLLYHKMMGNNLPWRPSSPSISALGGRFSICAQQRSVACSSPGDFVEWLNILI